MVEAVIFDIDGTIIDSVDFHIKAWQAAFKKFGKDIPFQGIRPQIGKDADEMLAIFLRDGCIKRLR
jgi:beta-phosphoglucomutase-like phosphatase (HAD superfamily)